MSDTPSIPNPADLGTMLSATAETIPTDRNGVYRDPMSRKLVGGLGLGGALTVLIASAVTHGLGYTPSADEVIAVSTVVSFLIGRYIKEEL